MNLKSVLSQLKHLEASIIPRFLTLSALWLPLVVEISFSLEKKKKEGKNDCDL